MYCISMASYAMALCVGADTGLFRGEWLGALAIHSFDIPLNIDNICEAFKRKHPRKMCSPSILYD